MGKKIPPEVRAEVIRLRLEGTPTAVVSAKLGVSEGSVTKYTTEALQTSIVGIVDGGMSPDTIADRLNMKPARIWRIYNEAKEAQPEVSMPGAEAVETTVGIVEIPPPEGDAGAVSHALGSRTAAPHIEAEPLPEVELELDDKKRLRNSIVRALQNQAQAQADGNMTAAAKFEKLAAEYSDQLRKISAKENANEDVWQANKADVRAHTQLMHEIIQKLVADFNRGGFTCDSCGRKMRTRIASDGEVEE